MKIGIITVNFADYGSFAQATALYQYLEQLGHEPEFINECYRYPVSGRLYLGYLSNRYFPGFLKRFLAKRNSVLSNYYYFSKELKSYRISPRFRKFSEIEGRYDKVIIGSDELWAVQQPSVKYVPLNFSVGIHIPAITYAVSGVSLTNPEQYINEEMKQGIKNLQSVSVRDMETLEWVQRLTGVKASHVLDPTLLNPYFRGTFSKVGDYITVYGEEFEKEHIDAMTQFAKEKNQKLLAISWPHDWCDEFISPESFSEVQDLFANATYCMTSTFHGTIFALVNERPFTCFSSKIRGLKVQSLLRQLNLTDRYYTPEKGNNFNMDINYDEINKVLQQWREKSHNYLKQALSFVSST